MGFKMWVFLVLSAVCLVLFPFVLVFNKEYEAYEAFGFLLVGLGYACWALGYYK